MNLLFKSLCSSTFKLKFHVTKLLLLRRHDSSFTFHNAHCDVGWNSNIPNSRFKIMKFGKNATVAGSKEKSNFLPTKQKKNNFRTQHWPLTAPLRFTCGKMKNNSNSERQPFEFRRGDEACICVASRDELLYGRN